MDKGECFCGAVHVEVSGEPEAMGYCHCQSCRSWSAAPVNAFTLWKPDAVRVTAGAEYVATFQKTKFSQRQYCKKCGGHLMNNHPTIGLVDVCSYVTHLEVQRGFSYQLCRYSFAYAGRTPQAEGFSQRVWRLGRMRAGVTEHRKFGNDSGDDELCVMASGKRHSASRGGRFLGISCDTLTQPNEPQHLVPEISCIFPSVRPFVRVCCPRRVTLHNTPICSP
jgi:hypothetical protein